MARSVLLLKSMILLVAFSLSFFPADLSSMFFSPSVEDNISSTIIPNGQSSTTIVEAQPVVVPDSTLEVPIDQVPTETSNPLKKQTKDLTGGIVDTLKPRSTQSTIISTAIYIVEDADFPSAGFSGSGTVQDPYVLENVIFSGMSPQAYEITSLYNGDFIITIKNTRANFIIRNIVFDIPGGNIMSGIVLENVSNAVIEGNNQIAYTRDYILMNNATNVEITNNQFLGGAYIYKSHNIQIHENQIGYSEDLIQIYNSKHITLTENQLNATSSGKVIEIGYTDNVTITNNTFSQGNQLIKVWDGYYWDGPSTNLNITENTFHTFSGGPLLEFIPTNANNKAQNVTIAKNDFSFGSGLQYTGLTGLFQDCLIIDNFFNKAKVILTNSLNTSVVQNTFHDSPLEINQPTLYGSLYIEGNTFYLVSINVVTTPTQTTFNYNCFAQVWPVTSCWTIDDGNNDGVDSSVAEPFYYTHNQLTRPIINSMSIYSNDGFLSNGFTGTGIEEDPYTLSNRTFISSFLETSPALTITGTNAYFRIIDCTFVSLTGKHTIGALFINVSHSTILTSSFLTNNTQSIKLENSSANSFVNNTLFSEGGLSSVLNMSLSDNNHIVGNIFNTNVTLYGSSSNIITDNCFNGSSLHDSFLLIHGGSTSNLVKWNNYMSTTQNSALDDNIDTIYGHNYWGTFTGPDNDVDGFVDQPFSVLDLDSSVIMNTDAYARTGLNAKVMSMSGADDFSLQGYSGAGSVQDPYVVEYRMFVPGTTEGVVFNSLTSVVVFRNNFIIGFKNQPNVGLKIDWTDHTLVEHNFFIHVTKALALGNSMNTSFTSNVALFSRASAVEVFSSVNTTISNNLFYQAAAFNPTNPEGSAIRLTQSSSGIVVNNIIGGRYLHGVYVSYSDYVNVSANRITRTNAYASVHCYGIFIEYWSTHHIIEYNYLRGHYYGLNIEQSCNYGIINYNRIYETSFQAVFISGMYNKFTWNTFSPDYYSSIGQYSNDWDNYYFHNYYKEFSGTDGDSDGFSETSYNPTSHETDLEPILIPIIADMKVSSTNDFYRLGLDGSGTENDPFIVDGFMLVSSTLYSPFRVNGLELNIVVNNSLIFGNWSHVGAYLDNSRRIVFQNVVFNNCTTGLYLENSQGNNFFENTFQRVGTAISLTGSDNNSITNNTVWYPTQFGVSVSSSLYNKLMYNNITGSGTNGVLLTTGSQNNNLTLNHLSLNTKGVVITSSSNNYISWNTIVGSTSDPAFDEGLDNVFTCNYYGSWSGLDANKDGLGDDPRTIQGSSNNQDLTPLTRPLHLSMYLMYEDDFVRAGFTGSGTSEDPFLIDGYFFLATVDHPTPITVSSWFYVRLHNVVIRGLGSAEAVSVSGSQVIQMDNSVVYGAKIGLNVTFTGFQFSQVTNSFFHHNKDHAIYFRENVPLVFNNTFWDNYGSAIALATVHYSNISQNVITNSGTHGIETDDFISNNEVHQNTIRSSGGSAIIIRSSSGSNSFTRNLLDENVVGITLSDTSNNLFIYNTILNSHSTGVVLGSDASSNSFRWNNIVDSTSQSVVDDGVSNPFSYNYYSDWLVVDVDHNGIGEGTYNIPGAASNTDLTPLARQVHQRILIQANKDFFSAGFSGSGTEADPFFLGGAFFVSIPEFLHPFEVVGTNAHFVLQDSLFHGWGDEEAVRLTDVTHALLRNLTISNYNTGIYLANTSYSVLEANSISDSVLYGISSISFSHHLTVRNNTVQSSGDGNIFMQVTSYSTVFNNTLLNGVHHGIVISGASAQNNLSLNNLTGNGWSAILLHPGSENNTLADNYLLNNNIGLNFLNSDRNQVRRNQIIGCNEYGIVILTDGGQQSDNNIFEWNSVVNTAQIPVYDEGFANSFTYNYYSSYAGMDLDEDGVGDSPHPIQGPTGSQDLTPRMVEDQLFTNPAVVYPNGHENVKDLVNVLWKEVHDGYQRPITYSLEYSTDNGSSWQGITTGLTTGNYNWDISGLVYGADFLVRVHAFHLTNLIVSDRSNQVFVVSDLPIVITNNNDFVTQGYSGLGTVASPYIIQDLVIYSRGPDLISISDTNVYFYIYNVTLIGLSENNVYCGIHLLNVSLGKVEVSTVDGTSYGVILDQSDGVSLLNNTITGSLVTAIYLKESNGNSITYNTVNNNPVGLLVENSANNVVGYNIITYATRDAIIVNSTTASIYTGNVIEFNMISNIGECGIAVSSSDEVSIYNNTLVEISLNGVWVRTSNFASITNNSVAGTSIGIYVEHSSNMTIYGNILFNNTIGLSTYNVDHVEVDTNAIFGNQDGVRLEHSIDLFFSNNEINNNTQYGVEIINTNQTSITWNYIHHNNLYGISVDVSGTNNVILYNGFLGNNPSGSSQCLDNGSFNLWFNATEFKGNLWYGEPTNIPYLIDGQSSATDEYPLVSVVVTGPLDFSFNYGETGYTIIWVASAPYPGNAPGSYTVFQNGVNVSEVSWSGAIIFSLDGLNPGYYNFTILVFNSYGFTVSDTVRVNVVEVQDAVDPTLSSPNDVNFEENSVGYTITWAGSDLHPWLALVYRNGSVVYNQSWIGEDIIVSLVGLEPGVYNFTCVVFDLSGNSQSDSVLVQVFPLTPDETNPVVTPIGEYSYVVGTNGHYLVWNSTEDHPHSYQLFFNGTLVEQSPWWGGLVNTSVDGLAVGVWNITIVFFDLSGNQGAGMTFVTVVAAPPDLTAPTIKPPESLSVEQNKLGVLVWEVADTNPGYYSLYRNDTLVSEGFWTTGIIRYSFTNLSTGQWLFNLTIWDLSGNHASNIVVVHIQAPTATVDTTDPQISNLPDTTVVFGTLGNYLLFQLFDEHPGQIWVTINSTKIGWFSWDVPNQDINVSLDGLGVGIHLVNVTAVDMYGNSLMELVVVTVVGKNAPPVITSFGPLFVTSNESVPLLWLINGTDLSHYEVRLLPSSIIIYSGSLNGSSATISHLVTSLSNGNYTYRITVWDGNGQYSLNDLFVLVSEGSGSGSTLITSSPGFELLISLLALGLCGSRLFARRNGIKKDNSRRSSL